MNPPRIIGIRHHSPACAGLVARTIASMRPQAVLIEGPSDFNARLDELMLDHEPPLAIYSHAQADGAAAQCWFPLLEHSPEWVALREGRAAGAEVRFIDLPHWRYRAVPDEAGLTAGRPRSRYGRVEALLRERLRCDSGDVLWDHLFEGVGTPQAVGAGAQDADGELSQRLSLYFEELRGDDPGSGQDRAREALMADWMRWASRRFERVLVVCGGWHKPALERAWQSGATRATDAIGAIGAIDATDATDAADAANAANAANAIDEEPRTPPPPDPRTCGSYLVPFDFRQVDALGGYRAGLPSPLYYRWLWRHGAARAASRATAAMVRGLRRAGVPFSTADLTAFERGTRALAALRGRSVPLRADLLDGLLGAAVKEALDRPAPWNDDGPLRADHHPVLREALLALTGTGSGRLHGDTPQPPLLRDAWLRLQQVGLDITAVAQSLVLDRRRPQDRPRSRVLWQLRVLGIGGVQLRETRAPGAARSLSPALHFEEHWQLRRDDRWLPDLIEASVHGATLEGAARQALVRRAGTQGGDPAALTATLLAATRAGLLDIGEALAERLRADLPRCHDHGALAAAARTLAELARTGFWSDDPRVLLERTLGAIAQRLLWLLDERGSAAPVAGATTSATTSATAATSGTLVDDDVAAVSVFDALLSLGLSAPDRDEVLGTMRRLAGVPGPAGRTGLAGSTGSTGSTTALAPALTSARPPALRGAALGLAYAQQALGDDDTARASVLMLLRAMPPRDALGDFLYGLFACARVLATRDDAITRALHATLETIGTEDFLAALPALRGAMGWLPARERGEIARHAARLMGRTGAAAVDLMPGRGGAERLLDVRRIEARALAVAREIGL